VLLSGDYAEILCTAIADIQPGLLEFFENALGVPFFRRSVYRAEKSERQHFMLLRVLNDEC